MSKFRVSPTRLQLYLSCARKWYYKEIMRLQAPTAAMAFGTDAHAVAEWHLKGRLYAPPSQDEWANTIGQLFAALTEEAADEILGIENEYTVTLPKGTQYKCRLDADGVIDGLPAVIDHKTSVNPTKYAKTEEELKGDLQAQMYAYALMSNIDTDAIMAHFHWCPSKKCKDPRAKTVITEVVFSRKELEEVAHGVEDTVESMQETAMRGQLPAPVWEENPVSDACDMYGGCKMYSRCMGDWYEAVGQDDDSSHS